MAPPFRQVRATATPESVRIYQAYPPEIATKALAAQTFKSPFKRDRMTWIKTSFTWMMYRAGWGTKPGQERILAVDLRRDGFESALGTACLSHFDRVTHSSHEEWKDALAKSRVRVQWDPERTVALEALPWRAIQVGLERDAVDAYLDEWILRIDDVTELARNIKGLVDRGDIARADLIRPTELPYPLPKDISKRIGCS